MVVAADAAFAKQLAATIAGLSSSATRDHEVFVLHDGYDLELRARVCAGAGDALTVRWLEVRPEQLRDARIFSHLSPSTLFRLQMVDLVPADLERLVYLDLDLGFREPLDELWAADLHGCVLGAVRDPVVPWAAAPHGLAWTQVGVAPDTPYFNAGVLVVDAGAWRSQQIGEAALDVLARHRLRYADQCALNAVLAGAWAPLGPRWNLQAGHLEVDGSLGWITEDPEVLAAAIEDPAIVHFNASGFGRPWFFDCTHPRRDLWFEQLDRTAWAGWRPSRTRFVASRLRRSVTQRLRR